MSGSSQAKATQAPSAESRAQTALERALTVAFWQALQQRPMPAMAALECAARTVGALYRQVAAAHGPHGTCPCGWEPDPEADLIMLRWPDASSGRRGPRHDGTRRAGVRGRLPGTS
jgi:hypothetical protein